MTLKQARKKCGGFTQQEFAALVGVSVVTVYNWEVGRSTPSLSKWKKAAEVLGISVSELDFERKEER